MSIFTNIYLGFSRKRFLKPFKPLSNKSRRNFLISAPASVAEFIRIMPYIAALKKYGTIVMLVPNTCKSVCDLITPNNFDLIFHETIPKVLSKEHNALKEQLREQRFHYIIELNKPANISLVYLTDVERRIAFYERKKFPYYNIMLRDSIESLCDFFVLRKADPKKIFKFYSRDIKSVLKRYHKQKPILFLNGSDAATWQGDKIILGKDVTADNPEVYKLILGTDAYCGQHDEFFEFAKMFNKEIIT
jgi:hypothetical protein